MSLQDIIKRKENDAKDHFSGKMLSEFSLSEYEFQLLVDLERTYTSYQNWAGIGVELYRPGDIYAAKNNLLNYIRGLKAAFDTILETEDGFRLGMNWQASLY